MLLGRQVEKTQKKKEANYVAAPPASAYIPSWYKQSLYYYNKQQKAKATRLIRKKDLEIKVSHILKQGSNGIINNKRRREPIQNNLMSLVLAT